ncbi:nuclear transport factor 2 family protein [Micromonospora fulviviridis]|uniref:Nuclear transport factor 2 family protein n=1 Tax=Micromonospora fulviviridis TaxID=47860 RepID=A0ABV2VTJ2_9ACTN
MWHSDPAAAAAAAAVVGRDDDLKSLVVAYYRMVDTDDIDGFVALFEPDLRYDRPGAGQIVGRAALERFYRAQEPVASRVHVLSACLREGRHLAAHGVAERVSLDGQQTTIGFADFFTVSDAGLFAYRRTFFHVPFAASS